MGRFACWSLLQTLSVLLILVANSPHASTIGNWMPAPDQDTLTWTTGDWEAPFNIQVLNSSINGTSIWVQLNVSMDSAVDCSMKGGPQKLKIEDVDGVLGSLSAATVNGIDYKSAFKNSQKTREFELDKRLILNCGGSMLVEYTIDRNTTTAKGGTFKIGWGTNTSYVIGVIASNGDPAITIGSRGIARDGNTLYVYYANGTSNMSYVARSTDNGITWNPTWAPLSNGTNPCYNSRYSGSGGGAGSLALDSSGNIHVLFQCYNSTSSYADIVYRKINSAGTTLTDTVLSGLGAPPYVSPEIAVSSNDTIMAGWQTYVYYASGNWWPVGVRWSYDGGTTWSNFTQMYGNYAGWPPVSLTSNQSGFYITYTKEVSGTILSAKSFNGTAWSAELSTVYGSHYAHQICATPNGTIHVLEMVLTYPGTTYLLDYSNSQNFSNEILIMNASVGSPQIKCVDNNRIQLVWATGTYIDHTESLDGGATWGSIYRAYGNGGTPRIAANDGVADYVYTELSDNTLRYGVYIENMSSWQYNQKLDTLFTAGGSISSTLANFPARVVLDTTNSTYFNTTNCLNVRFTSNLTTNETLLYELDSGCNSTTTTYWVQVPSQQSTSSIYAWFGNTANTDSQTGVRAIWTDANYGSVYHMQASGTLTDSAGNNNLAKTGTCNIVTGRWGNAINFTGGCRYSKTSSLLNLPTGAGVGTETIWAYHVALSSTNECAYEYGYQQAGKARSYLPRLSGISNMSYSGYGGGANDWTTDIATPTGLGKWYFAATQYDGSSRYIYKNVTTSRSNTFAANTVTSILYVGSDSWGSATDYLTNSVLDEFRIRNVASTTDWLTAEQQLYYGVNGNPVNDTLPNVTAIWVEPSPAFYGNSPICKANVTQGALSLSGVNFTIITPGNSTIELGNGTQNGATWSSSSYTLNETGTWRCTAKAYDANGGYGTKTMTFTAKSVPTYLFQSASPSSAGAQGDNITFSCNYLDNDGHLVTNATCYVNINGTQYSADYSGTDYAYSTSQLGLGDNSWFCNCSKTYYDAALPTLNISSQASGSPNYRPLGYNSSTTKNSQSFIAPGGWIRNGTVGLSKSTVATLTITVSIRSSLTGPNLASATILPTQITSTDPANPTWANFTFSPALKVTPGATYYLVLTTSGYSMALYYKWSQSSDVYPYGIEYYTTSDTPDYTRDFLSKIGYADNFYVFQNPQVTAIWTEPSSPAYFGNVSICRANVSQGTYALKAVNFTITMPDNGTIVLGNGTKNGITWTSANFTLNETGSWTCVAKAYDVNGNYGSGVVGLDAEPIPAYMYQSASPSSPQIYGTNVTFSRNYVDENQNLIQDATVNVNLNGVTYNTTLNTSYEYATTDLALGDHDWYCMGSKYGYEAVNATEDNYTIDQIPTDLYQSASPSSPRASHTNITFACNYEDAYQNFIQDADVYVNIDGVNYSTVLGTFYEYSTDTLAAGDHPWSCIASKYGYESKNGSEEMYTVRAITHNYDVHEDSCDSGKICTDPHAARAADNQSIIGYMSYYDTNMANATEVCNRFQNDAIFTFNGHGLVGDESTYGGGFLLCNAADCGSAIWVYANNYTSEDPTVCTLENITGNFNQTLLAIFNACASAHTSAYGNLMDESLNHGAHCVIGFDSPTLYDDAANYWDEIFWKRITNDNFTILAAANNATLETCNHPIYGSLEDCAGVETIVISGDCNVTLSPQRNGQ